MMAQAALKAEGIELVHIRVSVPATTIHPRPKPRSIGELTQLPIAAEIEFLARSVSQPGLSATTARTRRSSDRRARHHWDRAQN